MSSPSCSFLSEALAILEPISFFDQTPPIISRRNLAELASGAKGGLEDWQIQHVKKHTFGHLESRLRRKEVADQLQLSTSHFTRAFKATTGVTYSKFRSEARIKMTQYLLLTTNTSLAEVAARCGLSDQSHLSRLFRQSVGLPPAAWRRQFFDLARRDLSQSS